MKMKLTRGISVALLTLMVAQLALAQSDSSARVGITVKHDSVAAQSSPGSPPTPQRDTLGPTWKNIGTGMLIGTGIGVGLGFVSAIAVTSGHYLDHSEDGLVYLVFAEIGGVVGLVVGMIAGAMHR